MKKYLWMYAASIVGLFALFSKAVEWGVLSKTLPWKMGLLYGLVRMVCVIGILTLIERVSVWRERVAAEEVIALLRQESLRIRQESQATIGYLMDQIKWDGENTQAFMEFMDGNSNFARSVGAEIIDPNNRTGALDAN